MLIGFDQQMAELVGKYMANHGTKFIRPAEPTKVEKLGNVTYKTESGIKEVTSLSIKRQFLDGLIISVIL
jgi:pyruvate/2-oxoglutarate dehydrogenase complex dihydrolipoamide dehydrogenase (E3) component